ncbi:MAG: methyltransferase domain-containing protein [Gemmatimonadota bacterium]|nr:methyltransferase domain-containing protein [Gemmatimonadota bacterium]
MTQPLEDLSGKRLVAALEKRFDTVIEDVPVADRTFSILRPRKSDDLIREEDFVEDERLPYWADIWPASTILAERILARNGHGRRLLELGCGVGLVTTAAMASGHEVLASDYYTDALAFTRANAFQNLGKSPEARMLNWRSFPADATNFDKVIASDVLYESEYAKILPRVLMRALSLHGVALIADPGRIAAPEFLGKCENVGLEILGKETFPYEIGEIKQQIDVYELGRTK